ncbi:hypothetical protein LXM94_02650 [Rhizobium sp. TRM95111]|uniref:hypothetical protein n=1 Tax=Rhizobium alarense TaxID=2846851 RepID=UPI001F329A71|nr:hypothetical protein [Rhizobium alarense]MCF3638868.1 hypothetical protein [Rhizobium alarense]
MDDVARQQQEYQVRLNRIWTEAIKSAFGDTPPASTSWQDPYECWQVLEHFMLGNYSFLPPNGHLPLRGVHVHEDGKRLLFDLSESGFLEASPALLHFEYIAEAPIESFFLLDLKAMRSSEVYENAEIDEQVVRIDGEDYEYGLWEHGVWHFDEEGNEVPVPEDAKTVLRLLSGKVLIVSQGSMWNHTNETWDGRHTRMSASDIRTIIERSLPASSSSS